MQEQPVQIQQNPLKTNINIQTGISIYSIKPGVLEFSNGTLSLTFADGKVAFSVPIQEVTKIKNYGEFLYIWVGRKSHTVNFAEARALKREMATTVGLGATVGGEVASAGIAGAASREAQSYDVVESWIQLFRSYGITAKHGAFYRSPWMWVLVAVVGGIFLLRIIKVVLG